MLGHLVLSLLFVTWWLLTLLDFYLNIFSTTCQFVSLFTTFYCIIGGFLGVQQWKICRRESRDANSLWARGSWVKNALPCSSFLAWQISWMQEPVGSQSMGLQGVRQYWATEHIYCIISYLKFTSLKQQFFCLQSVNE